MVESCCVEGCNSATDDLQYFKFPTSRTLKQKWLQAVSVSGALTLSSVVCSRHFSPQDYELVRGKTRLKRRVVPAPALQSTKSLPSPSPTEDVSCDHSINLKDEPPDIVHVHKTDNAQENIHDDKNKTEDCTDVLEDSQNAIEDHVLTNKDTVDSNDTTNRKKGNNEKKDNTNHKKKKKKTDAVDNKLDLNNVKNKENDDQNSTDNAENIKTDDSTTQATENGCDEVKVLDSTNLSSENSEVSHESLQRVEDVCKVNTEPEMNKDADIEDIITNYHIKQTKKLPHDPVEDTKSLENDVTIDVDNTTLDVEYVSTEVTEPMFIEVSTDKEGTGVANEHEDQGDCLMLLENVEVELDPSSLIFQQDSEVETESEITVIEPIKENPISLLTSSDEDEVIIQEPKIDTIEVSDEDEDDVPLVNLFVTKQYGKKKHKSQNLFQYCCLKCHYRTRDKKEFKKHAADHLPPPSLRACNLCSYTTLSAAQFTRHQQKHKLDRNFKCSVCSYRARHQMSLIYHMKTHSEEELTDVKSDYKCESCGYGSDAKSEFLSHLQLCSTDSKRFSCSRCSYNTNRSSDMKRHRKRRHDDDDEDDEDYLPG